MVDETLSYLGAAVTAILEHVTAAGVSPQNVTLLCAPTPESQQTWLDDLPEAFQDVRLEIHHPDDRTTHAYLATTRAGKRLYMNRTLVDADQIIVLSSRRYDLLFGIGGAAGAIYPTFSDTGTHDAMKERIDLAAPTATPWPTRGEAMETAWLLGAPFFVQVVEGSGDDWAYVIAGADEASTEAERLLDARWRRTVAQPADVVIASIGGNPARHTFADLASAAASAARGTAGRSHRAVDPGESQPGHQHRVSDGDGRSAGGVELAAQGTVAGNDGGASSGPTLPHERLYLLSAWPGERVEELFATSLENARQAQRPIDAGGLCLVLDDAHKTMAVLAE